MRSRVSLTSVSTGASRDNAAAARGWSREDTAGTLLKEMAAVHGPALLKWALAHAAHPSDAWDLVQDSFERTLRRRPRVANQTEMRRWLFTVIKNRNRDRCREAAVRATSNVDVETLPDTDAEDIVFWRYVDPAVIQALVPALSPPLRDALVLQMEGLPGAEIARRLRIPANTVASRVFRARRCLQRMFQAQYAPSDA